ncbi:MAG TPA: acylphosphatase [Acidimicrobiales bacterium]|nr:acylphosphatase [Acidimicrobiales bacterium]
MTTDGQRVATVRRRVVVDGFVQGVGFRASCARRAADAGLGGWVRNLADGRVEAVFEGRSGDVEALVAWCRQGPPLARVTRVTLVDEPTVHELGFTVR